MTVCYHRFSFAAFPGIVKYSSYKEYIKLPLLKIVAAKANLIFMSLILLMVKLEIELMIFDLSKCLFPNGLCNDLK